MKRINKFRVSNFKAFKTAEEIDFEGKNILVYGINGSGKSSLYWSIYTFLQSSIKTKSEVEKYFNTGEENLKNIHAQPTDDSYIELELIDKQTEIKQTYRISETVVNTNNQEIKEANQASDFINYRLLLNFYNSAHSEEIELFWVFNRDILPYFNNSHGQNFGAIIKELIINTPERKKESEKTRRGISNLSSATISRIYKDYDDLIRSFNTELRTFILGLNQPANSFLNNHFLNGDNSLRIELEMTAEARYDRAAKSFYSPFIRMKVSQLLDDGAYQIIYRPHSFLNEARLTQIALSVRLAAMQNRPQTTDLFRFLVLDDMLISLDMSNRMQVIKIILEEFDDFQLIILTHDLAFYELIKRRTLTQDWKYLNFEVNEAQKHPIISERLSEIEKAKVFFESREYDACANYLRKETEKLLNVFLSKDLRLIKDEFVSLSSMLNKARNITDSDNLSKFRTLFRKRLILSVDQAKLIRKQYENRTDVEEKVKKELTKIKSELLDFFIQQYEKSDKTERIFKELECIKDRILNPLSHGSTTPLYHQELKDAIIIIEELKVFLDSH